MRVFRFRECQGFDDREHSRILDELIETFNAHGYEVVVPYSVLNAADFGVPQDRRRLFLMAQRKACDCNLPAVVTKPRTTVWQAIGDIPTPMTIRTG